MRRGRGNRTGADVAETARDGLDGWIAALGIATGGGPIDVQATAEKLRTLAAIAPWATAAHLVAAIALLPGLRTSPDHVPLLPVIALFGLVMALDAGANVLLRTGVAAHAMPRRLAQASTLYGLVLGLCWGALLLLVPTRGATDAAAFAAAAAVTAVVLAPLPAAAIAFVVPLFIAVNCLVLRIDFALLLAVLGLFMGTSMLDSARRSGISFRRRMEEDWSARTASHLLAEFEENKRGWFWETNMRGELTYISSQLAHAIDRGVDDLLGRPFTDLVSDDGDQGSKGERTLGFHLSTRLAFSDVAVRAALSTEVRWWSLSGRPAFDEFRNFLGFRGNGTDLTETRRSEAEINRLARYDALTSLPNRLLMRQTLEDLLGGGPGRSKPCALFLLDLDRFKSVNDTLGHPVGDGLLRQVAERLQRVIGKTGQVGRIGGDEFEVVLPGLDDRARLGQLAQTVIEKLSMPYMIEGSNVSIGASVGIAIAHEDGATADSLIRNADLALYAAKAAGKGVHRFYEQQMHADAKDRRLLEIDLRNVLSEGGLHLVYQPVVDARTEVISGFEALARWDHPTRGSVSPANFIPVAEEIGLISQIGEWVIRTACIEAAKWPDPVRVAVNISPIQFANPALPGIVMSALATAQLPANRLELEITEGVFLNDSVATDTMFARLKAIGVRLALDDFGTGYSSLGYLKKAPFNKIKIDQSFVRGAAIVGNRNAAIIKAIVSLAESLGMETTAEGAETHDELELIRTLGCSHIQGFIFGRPMQAVEALARATGDAPMIADGFLASRDPRVAVLRSVTLRYDGRSIAGRVRNLSTSGAMVEADRAIPTGTSIEMLFSDGSIHKGAVRWCQDGRFGMIFDRPFDLDLLNSQKQPAARLRAG